MHDTVIVAKLADPTSTGAAADGLKPLALGVLGDASVAPAADIARDQLFKAGKWLKTVKVDTAPERSGWASVDPACATMLRYAASDVLDTAAVRRALPAPDPQVFERERLAQRMTARVTHHGMRIDAEHVARLTAEHTAARDAATAAIRAFGVDNPGSDAQVGQIAASLGAALPQTPTGRPSVAAAALEALRGSEGALGEFVRAVLEHRHHDTVLGTFLGPYAELCRHGDGRARPTVYTLGTDTGRMSCVRPNLQQLPRKGGVRACITADPGHVLISADFSGVELRVAAALSGDPTLTSMILEGRDLHAEIARLVYGPDATSEHRSRCKRGVFGRIYGGGLAAIAAGVGTDTAGAQRVIDAMDTLTPQLSAWSAGMRDAVRAGNTRLPTYAGRVIHLPREYPHKAPNYAIQGTARELLVDALVRWADTRWGRAVLIPVHDELIVHVPEEDGAEATAELIRAMTGELYGIPIVVEADAPTVAWQDA
jgi:DNA polymerase I-like protein with 3'-5' exonuclease and polymerase domains